MSQDTLSNIIYVLIGFVPSSLVALTVHFLQSREKQKDRERKITEKRIDQIESGFNKMLELFTEVKINPYEYISIYEIDAQNRRKDIAPKLSRSLAYFLQLLTPAYLLKDTPLTNLVTPIAKDMEHFIVLLNGIDVMKSVEESEQKMITSLDLFFDIDKKILLAYPQILDRLDYLRKRL